MNTISGNEQIWDALAKVVELANKDAQIRERALSDVYATVKEVTGVEVPREFKINVVDGTGYHVNIVLPASQGANGELTEEELDKVAGGFVAPQKYPWESLEDYAKRLEQLRKLGIMF